MTMTWTFVMLYVFYLYNPANRQEEYMTYGGLLRFSRHMASLGKENSGSLYDTDGGNFEEQTL